MIAFALNAILIRSLFPPFNKTTMALAYVDMSSVIEAQVKLLLTNVKHQVLFGRWFPIFTF